VCQEDSAPLIETERERMGDAKGGGRPGE